MKIKTSSWFLLFVLLLSGLQVAQAHGYLLNSRAHYCSISKNTNCGAIQWEPQSVEGPDRYPETGAKDGTLAAGGNPGWGALNEQTEGRWAKFNLTSGNYTFEWKFTAPHASRDIRYWITKADWNPNQPLARAAFEAQPFCSVQYNNKPPVPSTNVTAKHDCVIPQRTGYHVILSVWDVADTVNSFYSVMDASFGASQSNWTQVGTIFANTDLPVGAQASTRVFYASGEQTQLATSIKILNQGEGAAAKWPHKLADAINAQNIAIRAGLLSGDQVNAVDGNNAVYASKGSAITRVEISTSLPSDGTPLYPVGLGSYGPGSKVKSRDGKVYQCLDWPQSSWCNGAAAYYEPGYGSAWQQAWRLLVNAKE